MSKVVATYSPNRAKIFKPWFGNQCILTLTHFALIIWNVRKRLTGIGNMPLIPESGHATNVTTRLQTGCIRALAASANLS